MARRRAGDGQRAKATGAAFAAALVDVDVDVGPARSTSCAAPWCRTPDAIHPAYVEGQMQGGTVQGLGWALNEEYVYDAEVGS